MARELKPCGTNAAYMRHKRRGEDPCDACRDAHAALKRAKDMDDRAVDAARVAEVVQAAPPVDEVDPLEEALDSLRIVRAVLRDGETPANTIAQLTRRRDELVDRIKALREAERPAEVSLIDELTNRRRERRSAAAG